MTNYLDNLTVPNNDIEKIFDILGEGIIIAGGCFKDVNKGIRPKDYDVWFKTPMDFAQAATILACDTDCSFLYNSDKAIGYSVPGIMPHVELILFKFGNVKDILDCFDFTITQYAIYKENHLFHSVCNPDFAKDLKDHNLNVTQLEYPAQTLARMFRYTTYGYYPTPLALQKVCREITKMSANAKIDLSPLY